MFHALRTRELEQPRRLFPHMPSRVDVSDPTGGMTSLDDEIRLWHDRTLAAMRTRTAARLPRSLYSSLQGVASFRAGQLTTLNSPPGPSEDDGTSARSAADPVDDAQARGPRTPLPANRSGGNATPTAQPGQPLRVASTLQRRSLIRADLSDAERPEYGGFYNLEFTPGGECLVATASNGAFLLLDPRTYSEVGRVSNAHGGEGVNVVRFLNERVFATGGDDFSVKLWDLRKCCRSTSSQPNEARFVQTATTPAASLMNRVTPLQELRGHHGWVKNVEIARDGRLVTAGMDNTIRLWSVHQQTHGVAASFEINQRPAALFTPVRRNVPSPATITPVRTPHPVDAAQQQINELLNALPADSFRTPPRDGAGPGSETLPIPNLPPAAASPSSSSLSAAHHAGNFLSVDDIHENFNPNLIYYRSFNEEVASRTEEKGQFRQLCHTLPSFLLRTLEQMRSIVTAPKHQSAHPASWNGNAEAGLANGAEPVLHFPPFLCRMRLSRDGTQMVIALRDALLLVSNLNLDTLAEDFGQSQLQWLAEHGFVQHYDLPSKTWQPHSMLSDESADDPPAARSRQRNHIELLEESPTRTGVCTTLHFDPSGRFLLTRRSCERDEQSIVFDLHSKRPVEDSPIGERLRSSDSSSRLSQFRELQERPLGSAHVPWIASVTESGTAPEYIKEACFSADGRFIASPYQRTVRVFDFENAFMRYSTHGVQCPELPPILSIPTHHSESVLTCRFSPIMPVLVTAGLDGRVVFYNPQF